MIVKRNPLPNRWGISVFESSFFVLFGSKSKGKRHRYDRIQTNTKHTDNDKDNDNDNVSDNKNFQKRSYIPTDKSKIYKNSDNKKFSSFLYYIISNL